MRKFYAYIALLCALNPVITRTSFAKWKRKKQINQYYQFKTKKKIPQKTIILVALGTTVGIGFISYLAYRNITPDSPNLDGTKINSKRFYKNWSGHEIGPLRKLYEHINSGETRPPIIWLAGDSILDNKYWLESAGKKPATKQYEDILNPPIMAQDIAYNLNKLLEQKQSELVAINTAVEATTLGMRINHGLLEQDIFARDRMGKDDCLIVAIGGNDVVLRPSIETQTNLGLLMRSDLGSIESGTAPGMAHFVNLFKNEVKKYIELIISKQKPAKILVCMFYYPCEVPGESWAKKALKALNYDAKPEKMQAIIRKIYELATSKIKIQGTKVIAVPLFDILNSKDSNDYVERVEPSATGGKKMGQEFIRLIEEV